MAKTDFKSVAEYIAAQPRATASVLAKVRSILKKALPNAEEVISYQIPAYKLDGRAAIYFAGYKEHFSVYPASDAVLHALGESAKKHLASKATLRFALDEPLPAKLIERVAKVRALELADTAVARQAKAKTKVASKAKVKVTTEVTAKVKSASAKSQANARTKPKRNAR